MTMRGSAEFDGNISMRPAGPADKQFLSDLFHQTRNFIYLHAENEHDYKRFVVEHQEQIRETGYGQMFPNSMDFIIEDARTPIGRVQIDFSDNYVHVIDIAIEAKSQRQGIAENVMRGLQRVAGATGAPMILSVRRDNLGARRLYAKLGFELHESRELEDALIWRPTGAVVIHDMKQG